jgi:hypothetical protein
MWDLIEKLIDENEIVACGMVKTELEVVDDELLKWIKSKKGFFVADDDAQQGCCSLVVSNFPNWVRPSSGKNRADPFVVGLGMAHGLTVVTYEGRGSAVSPQVPYVCDSFGVPCLHFVDFLREIGFKS